MQNSNEKLGNICILGAGKTGLNVARYTTSLLNSGVDSVCVYTGKNPCTQEVYDELVGYGCEVIVGERVEKNYDLCITSPGISEFSDFFLSAKQACKEIVSEPEFAYRQSSERWIAITGTNGKTTVTSLTNFLLNSSNISSYAVGNIGNNCISEVKNRKKDSWFVAELSSYQLAVTSQFHPRVAAILNITPDHLAWHKTHKNYADAKKKAFANLDKDDLCAVAYDEGLYDFIDELSERGLSPLIVNVDKDPNTLNCAFVDAEGYLCVRLEGRDMRLINTSQLNIFGAHNQENALMSASIALWCGASVEDICKGLTEFKPLEHRIESVGRHNSVLYVNDSKATNTDACLKALSAFDKGSINLMCGGFDKGTDLTDFSMLATSVCSSIVCFGQAGKRFEEALLSAAKSQNKSLPIKRVDTFKDAFILSGSLADKDQVVLLSPACASFDEFGSFEERGCAFKSLFKELEEGKLSD